MGATERLLEYIGEHALAAYSELPTDSDAQSACRPATTPEAVSAVRRQAPPSLPVHIHCHKADATRAQTLLAKTTVTRVPDQRASP
jgi:hypothetical protein